MRFLLRSFVSGDPTAGDAHRATSLVLESLSNQ
jgi:hypothetical protein